MNPLVYKLKSLYEQLDRHQAAGDDVVAEVRAEINNLELSYLKEEVFPEMANMLAKRIGELKCQIDFSFVFNGENELDYTFCTSGSTLMVRDKVVTNAISETPIIEPYTQGLKEEAYSTNSFDSEQTVKEKASIRIENYSKKAIAVYGDTKPYSEYFKNHGGYFNSYLRGGAGWVFSKKREAEIRRYLIQEGVEFQSAYVENRSSKESPVSVNQPTPATPVRPDVVKTATGFNVVDFKRYLSTVDSQHGRGYSPSSISVYGSALKSAYMVGKVKKFLPSGNIFNITSPTELSQIYADVLHDVDLKLTSTSYAIALKLYIRFFNEVKKGEYTLTHSKEEISTSRSERLKESVARAVPHNGKLKRIETPDFKIWHDNATQMMIDFVSRIGPERVYNLRIPYLGRYVVDKERHPKYFASCKFLPGGFWVNTCSSTPKKIEQMSEIADRLGIEVKFITE